MKENITTVTLQSTLSPLRKFDKFTTLLRHHSNSYKSKGYVISSNQSPIFEYITKLKLPNNTHVIDVLHKNIKDHPDVGPNSINILTMVINELFYQFTELPALTARHSLLET